MSDWADMTNENRSANREQQTLHGEAQDTCWERCSFCTSQVAYEAVLKLQEPAVLELPDGEGTDPGGGRQ